jgi:hypothetical protein
MGFVHDQWLDAVSGALADARAMLLCFGIWHPDLAARIDAALVEAQALKARGQRS